MGKRMSVRQRFKIVLISALAETFLRNLQKNGFIKYEEGTEFVDTIDDNNELGLVPMDAKSMQRLEKVRDLVLFRFGSTGIQDCLKTVLKVLNLIPVYPVRNINTFSSSTGNRLGGVFRDCVLVPHGTTTRQLAQIVQPGLEKSYLYAETIGNIQLGEDDLVTLDTNIVTFRTTQGN